MNAHKALLAFLLKSKILFSLVVGIIEAVVALASPSFLFRK